MEKPMEGVVQEIRSLAKRNKFKDIVKILSDLVHVSPLHRDSTYPCRSTIKAPTTLSQSLP